LCILFVIALVLFIPIKCIVSYDNERKLAVVRIFGITVYSSEKSKRKNKKQNVSEKKDGEKTFNIREDIKNIYDALKIIYRSARNELTVKKLYLSYKFGRGDAALTGIYAGVVYAVVHSLGTFVYNKFKVKQQKIDILPDFDNNIDELEVYIIIKLRVINLIGIIKNIVIDLANREEY